MSTRLATLAKSMPAAALAASWSLDIAQPQGGFGLDDNRAGAKQAAAIPIAVDGRIPNAVDGRWR